MVLEIMHKMASSSNGYEAKQAEEEWPANDEHDISWAGDLEREAKV